ncbi:MET25 protein, partial [Acromyrmex heyeri]
MDIDAEKKYFVEALCFFYETQWLHNIPVTEILTKTSLDAVPKEWLEQLQILENEELNNFVVEKIIKGYVCQMLHYLYGYQVLGLERDKKNISRAFTRQKKQYPDSLTKVKYTHCDITCDSANIIESILQQEFPDVTDVCLIGLHACGDLSTSASRIFCEMKSAKLFILISCCYHKLSISKSVQEKQYFQNFPTSNCLRETITAYNFDVGQFLRIPFLRLACQESADKWHGMSQEKHNEHSFYVLARAVLELYSRQNNYVLNKKVRKGTRKSQCSNFQTYVKDSLLRYDLVPDTDKTDNVITHEEMEKAITRVWEEQSTRLKAVEIYTGLQMMLQLPAESFILQDRLCWLHEQGLEAVTVPVMNKCISPRSYAIVSNKY